MGLNPCRSRSPELCAGGQRLVAINTLERLSPRGQPTPLARVSCHVLLCLVKPENLLRTGKRKAERRR